MSIWDWLRGKKEERALGPSSFGGALTLPANQAVPLNEQTALSISALFCGVNQIASAVAGLPLVLYQRTPQGKRRAEEHPLYDILQHEPNAEMTAFVFRHTLMHHVLLWGDGFAEIEFTNGGQVLSLTPLLPNRVRVYRDADTGEVLYEVFAYPTGGSKTLRQWEVLHIPGISYEGIRGMPPMMLARQSLDLTRHAEQFGEAFFRHGAAPSGALKYPGRLSDNARENIRQSWKQLHQGSSNAGSLPILEEGMDWIQFAIPPETAQYLQTRQFQVAEIARWLNIPPPLLHDLSRATWANLEVLNTYFVQYTLMPWLQKWEAEVRRKLLSVEERRTHFAEFDVNRLLRGDTKTRFGVYATALQNGIYSINECRELENLNAIEGGDEHRVQLNMQSADLADEHEDDTVNNELLQEEE